MLQKPGISALLWLLQGEATMNKSVWGDLSLHQPLDTQTNRVYMDRADLQGCYSI